MKFKTLSYFTAVDTLGCPPDRAGNFKSTLVHPSNNTLSHELEWRVRRRKKRRRRKEK